MEDAEEDVPGWFWALLLVVLIFAGVMEHRRKVRESEC